MPEPTRSGQDINETRGSMMAGDPNNGYSRTPADLPPGMNPAASGNTRPPTNGVGGAPPVPDNADVGGGESSSSSHRASDSWCIEKANAFYRAGRNYLDANITLGWERNLYHFRGEHGPTSPYVRRDWKRSHTFRPKTRANLKAQEAAHAAAAFATQDYLDCKAVDPTNEKEVIAAAIGKALLQMRLELVPWNWFVTAQGAFQDTKTYGIAASHICWRFKQIEEIVPAFDEEGRPIMSDDGMTPMGMAKKKTVYDMPCVDDIPPECLLFEPTCDWRNPAQTANWMVYLIGMTAGHAMEMMEENDPKTGMPVWRRYSLAQVLTASRGLIDDRTRRAREGRHRIDPITDPAAASATMVWAHFNIARVRGVDIGWFTLGTDLVLTDPAPLTEWYPHLRPGERPFVIGYSVIESHRNYPDGDVAQMAPLQEEINSVANQRLDNVKLVLNKRYFIRRGSQMDLEALMRNVPGGGVMTNDPEKDVQVVNTPDVTSSAYQEQDRLAQDLDDLVGGFGQASIAAGGKQMDRAGSMDVLQGAAGAVQDYGIKIFFETWMQPVLRQLMRLEQMYETDPVLLAVAAKQSVLWSKYGQDQVTDEALQQNMTVSINVGVGNTDPVKRVQKLTFGVQQVIMLPDMQRRVKSMELADEIFGALGYKDASRFFMDDTELKQHMQTSPPPPPPPEVQLKQQELAMKKDENDKRDARERARDGMDHEWRMKQLGNTLELGHSKAMSQEEIAKMKDKTIRDIGAAKEGNRLAEVNIKRADAAHDRLDKKLNPPKPPPGKGPPK
ncbi:MAG TPA: hypothetical protein VMH26_18285 [Burkholderiales bacterium]|nr:hypothetical protein [Burkholderiales bacterium]